MQPKFTKEKWERAEGSNIIWAGTKLISKVYIDPHNESDDAGEEEEANAHLIAAAPELYEALEMIIKDFDDPKTSGITLPVKTYKAVQAALKKARGLG